MLLLTGHINVMFVSFLSVYCTPGMWAGGGIGTWVFLIILSSSSPLHFRRQLSYLTEHLSFNTCICLPSLILIKWFALLSINIHCVQLSHWLPQLNSFPGNSDGLISIITCDKSYKQIWLKVPVNILWFVDFVSLTSVIIWLHQTT